jgi:vesicle-associated membrane protein 4
MAAAEQPYDPYIPAGSAGAAGVSSKDGNQRTAALQAVSPFPENPSTFCDI